MGSSVVGIQVEKFASGVQLSCVRRHEELIRQEAWRDHSMLHEAQFCKSASGASEALDADVVLADVSVNVTIYGGLASCKFHDVWSLGWL